MSLQIELLTKKHNRSDTNPESFEVELVLRKEVISLITYPVLKDRIEHLLNFDGEVVYKAYSNNGSYKIRENRRILIKFVLQL